MGYLVKVFSAAVRLVREDPKLKGIYSAKHLPPTFIDCGNTVFLKTKIKKENRHAEKVKRKKYEITTDEAKLNFAIALKDAGFPIQFMSDEPLRYLDILQKELEARGKPKFHFEDEHDLTILRKQLIDKTTQGLILIDNDSFSVPVQIKGRLFLDDPKFIEALEGFRNFETAVLPESMKPSVLWAMAP